MKPTWQQVARLFEKALRSGAVREGFTAVRWDVSGSCQSPAIRSVTARPEVKPGIRANHVVVQAASTARVCSLETPEGNLYIEVDGKRELRGLSKTRVCGPGQPDNRTTLEVILETKCRKCPDCLKKRAARWRLRAQAETAMSTRTWFGTLTLSPEAHQRALDRARLTCRRRGLCDFEALDASEQFALRVAEIGKELTLYLKRLRSATGARLRYLVVAEAHESGLPHLHALIHEIGQQVGERQLSGQWKLGFCRWRLVPTDNAAAAGYLCKYLSKDARSRVRASGHYGKGHSALRHSPPTGVRETLVKMPPKPPTPLVPQYSIFNKNLSLGGGIVTDLTGPPNG